MNRTSVFRFVSFVHNSSDSSQCFFWHAGHTDSFLVIAGESNDKSIEAFCPDGLLSDDRPVASRAAFPAPLRDQPGHPTRDHRSKGGWRCTATRITRWPGLFVSFFGIAMTCHDNIIPHHQVVYGGFPFCALNILNQSKSSIDGFFHSVNFWGSPGSPRKMEPPDWGVRRLTLWMRMVHWWRLPFRRSGKGSRRTWGGYHLLV